MGKSASGPRTEAPEAPEELRRIRIFKDMDLAQLARILPLLRHKPLRARATLVTQQEFAGQIGLVWSGRCRVTALAPNGATITVSTFEPGDAFQCAIGVLGHTPGENVRLVMDEAGLILLISAGDLLKMARESPALSQALLIELAELAVRFAARAYELAGLDVRGRLLAELVRLAENAMPQDGVYLLARAPTQAVIAAQIGATREAVTRHMRDLARDGMIRFRRGVIEFTNLDRLRALDKIAAGRVLYRPAGS
jgi:CRP/FNR family transcriptional regulator, cyclic AMP receptor protein